MKVLCTCEGDLVLTCFERFLCQRQRKLWMLTAAQIVL
jgi:hypothetical protein